jgi:hypothetical protein
MEFSTNIVLGVFESDASFIFWKLSMNGSKMTQQGVKGYAVIIIVVSIYIYFTQE